jgi:hypothetical protein
MNYYIIPKNKFKINIEIQLKKEEIKPYLSHSLIFYLKDVYKQLFKIEQKDNDNEIGLEFINKIINPYEFIHSNVPGTQLSVSKVKPDCNIFFELLEILQLFNINEILALKKKISIAHLTPNYSSTNYLLNFLREDFDDNIFCEDFDYDKLLNIFILNKFNYNLDLIICEFKSNDYIFFKNYIKNLLLIFSIIIKYQSNNGTFIIKIDNIFYKPIVDILFILTSLYEKVYIVRPTICNITRGERYIICKNFNSTSLNETNLLNQLETKIIKLLLEKNLDEEYINIFSILNNDIPYYFLNKLEESNAVIGQQQLESFDQIINIFM